MIEGGGGCISVMMNRTASVLGAVVALVLVAAASTLAAPSERAVERMAPAAASHQPDPPGTEAQDADEGPPSAELLDRLVVKLGDVGIDADADTIAGLAADYGVGGAVRLLAWADAAGMSADEIAAMFDSGLGWGEVAAQLKEGDASLDLSPGIGWIMGGGSGQGNGQAQGLGLGRAGAPGQQKKAQ